MDIILQSIAEYIPFMFYGILRASILFVLGLSGVYIFGRMLEIANTDISRNFIALFIIFPAAFISTWIYDMDIVISSADFYWRSIVYASLASMMYVLIGFKLFDRVDHFLDRKIAPDEKKEEE